VCVFPEFFGAEIITSDFHNFLFVIVSKCDTTPEHGEIAEEMVLNKVGVAKKAFGWITFEILSLRNAFFLIRSIKIFHKG
jgi:hypothetical protein